MTDDNPQLKAPAGEVFISYSWDNDHHVQAVLTLSNRLCSEGIDCVLDQYEQSPPEGWPRCGCPMSRVFRDMGTTNLQIGVCVRKTLTAWSFNLSAVRSFT